MSEAAPADGGPDATAFEERLREILNHASLALMISVGHRTRLFDTLAELEPSTAEEVAGAAGLEPRYVREWLGAMVVGRIVDYDPASGRYALPARRAARLVRAAGDENGALRMQYVSIFGSVEDRIVECFRSGGGVPYEAYDRFHRVQHEGTVAEMEAQLLDVYLPLVPGLADRLEDGADVLDVGCGAGRPVTLMAEAFPRSRFTGADIAEEAIASGRRDARERGLENATFRVADATEAVAAGRWDVVTAFDAIHDLPAPDTVVERIHEALRPGGLFFMLEPGASSRLEENLDHPMGAYLYTVSCLHCTTVSLAAGGPGLGATWGRQRARALLGDAGFADPELHPVPGDPTTEIHVGRKRAR